jgi:pimeloyl-ACP methyl ester carboxylesterase
VTRPTGAGHGGVADWPSMSQDRIAEQIAALTPAERRRLVEDHPKQVGNTDGVPWDMRIAANRINIAQAIVDERRGLQRPVEEKLRDVMRRNFPDWSPERGGGLQGPTAERVWAMLHADTSACRRAIAEYGRPAQQRIAFYQGLLDEVADPTGRHGRIDRKVLAFDPRRSSFVELIGDLDAAKGVGVLVPGLNTTIEGSAADTATATRFVQARHGDVAMITYLGGPFPRGGMPLGILDAGSPRYALDMAPRLVAFSEDVNRVVDATGRHIPVTYIGHSYGGSILGTAESLGLTADRTLYVEAAGAGVHVDHPIDWHNRNPFVQRFSMTAPGDLIEAVQGIPFGPHGADPDEMPGVTRLDTGYYDDGRLMAGPGSHSDVLTEPSDAWQNILSVIAGERFTLYHERLMAWAG